MVDGPHSDVPNHPEVLPPDSRDISGCHPTSVLCLSKDYQVAVQAGTALGEAGGGALGHHSAAEGAGPHSPQSPR